MLSSLSKIKQNLLNFTFILFSTINSYLPQRHWLVSSEVSFTSWGEGASSDLIGYTSVGGVTIEMPYGVDVLLHQPASHPSFPTRLVKTESDFIVRSVETGFREMNAGESCD